MLSVLSLLLVTEPCTMCYSTLLGRALLNILSFFPKWGLSNGYIHFGKITFLIILAYLFKKKYWYHDILCVVFRTWKCRLLHTQVNFLNTLRKNIFLLEKALIRVAWALHKRFTNQMGTENKHRRLHYVMMHLLVHQYPHKTCEQILIPHGNYMFH